MPVAVTAVITILASEESKRRKQAKKTSEENKRRKQAKKVRKNIAKIYEYLIQHGESKTNDFAF